MKRLADLLNVYASGRTIDQITFPQIMEMEQRMENAGESVDETTGDSAFVGPTMKVIYEVLNGSDEGDLKLSGLNHLLQYPEYADTEEFGELLGTLESQEEILELVSTAENDDINVLIGSESSVKVMNNSSLVFTPIKKNGHTIGVIGVLGPRRMNYKQVLKTLGDIGGSITQMMEEDRQLKEANTKEGDN
jgi:heat-inducible transcriptional repressor